MRRSATNRSGYTLFETALGTCGLAWGERGLARIWLPEKSGDREPLRQRIAREQQALVETRPPPEVRRALNALRAAVAGKPVALDALALDYGDATSFQRAIYDALKRTAPGETLSYGELAARAGRPGAARAVGQAMAKNPLPIVVPCHRVLGAGGAIGGFTSPGGTHTKAELLAREGVIVAPKRRALPYDVDAALARLRRDRDLCRLIDRVGPFTLRLSPRTTTFAALARAIVHQQLSGKAAATIHGRLAALFPKRRALHPADVASAPDEVLRTAGLSRPKVAAMRDLAARTLAGEVPSRSRLERMDDEAIVEALTRVRGIGRWTVEMLLIFQLGRPDVFPIDDFGIRRGFALACGLKEMPRPRELLAHGEKWRPYRTAASWYLWREADQ